MRSTGLGRALAAATVLAAAGWAGLAAAPAQAADTSQVYVVHGIPNTPVDVYVNGDKTLDNFQPGNVAGPLNLPAGSYDIDLTAPGKPISAAIVSAKGATVPANSNVSIVAHLKTDGTPTITPFVNDVSAIAAGQARLIVRHTAAAPAVDIRAGGTPVFTDLTNPNEAKADLPAGEISADVVLTGTDTVVLGPTNVNLKEGTATIIYAIGSADDKTLSTIAQTITGLHSAPGAVPGGDGGLAAASGTSPAWYAAMVVAMLLIIGGGARLTMGRRTQR